MFIRVILMIAQFAAIDTWFCFRIWFFHVLLKLHCNSLLLLSRLTRIAKKNWKKRRSESKTDRISHRDCRNVSSQWLVTRVVWATGLLNSEKQLLTCLDWKRNGKLNQITCTVLLFENYFTAHFMTACHRILIDSSFNKRFILMWVYRL